MAIQILTTKLFIPQHRLSSVSRPHLIERLNEGLAMAGRLSLISAPAGFGKTTVVGEWIANCGRPVAWLSLDEGDNDPARFTTYLIKALQTLALSQAKESKAGIGEGLLVALQSPQPLQIETILTTLLNEITTIPENFLLVLDDYHLIDSQTVDQSLAFLIEHKPPQMHLVIVTREDPPFPLASLRARGQLTELRAADLRFTPAEAAEFLNHSMGLNLSAEDIAALESRTEGWIAGLQMAAISMQGITETAGFIQSFTGSHHFVLDYLMEEVLQRQPESVQTFLLRTSILDRVCAPLCDAVLLDPSIPGQATLEYLEHANLFIVPLDNERRWYRYHHLFAELLRQRLQQGLTPEEIAELHIRASEWYENNGLILDAFRHAATGNDVERTMRLMESRKMPLHVRGTATTILDWLESLPDSVRNARPVLWWKQAFLMLSIGQTTDAEKALQAAEAALPSAALDETTRDLIGKIAVTRANLAQVQIHIETIFVQGRRALEYLSFNNLSHRSSATCALGYAYFWQDDWDEANRAYAEAYSLAQAAGDIPNSILALIRLGQLYKDQIHLHLAAETYQHALQLFGDYANPNAIMAYLGLTEVFYKWNDLDAAEQYAQQGLKLAQQYDQVHDRIIMSELHLALIKLARGELSRAAQLVSQAEQTARQKNYIPRQPNIAFFKAWVYLKQGDLDAAAALVTQNDLPLMRARVLIRQGEPSTALEFLGPLRKEAETKGWTVRLIDRMAVESVALYAHGEKEKAVDLLSKLLALTEPEDCIRPFLEEGELMAQLLSEAVILGIRPDFTRKLLAVFESEKRKSDDQPDLSPSRRLVEPLSERELEVLKLLRSELSGPEIAGRLTVSLNTLRSHTKNIFNKLGVNNRRAAVRRAGELDLF
ncbi:MAG TPA: LuxR C-terminal-related transcriptional regulator [Anaerolineales bacterium]|nr:LuxR C-terminal-related transcriptional regulator [Anaerolineales bacterium]